MQLAKLLKQFLIALLLTLVCNCLSSVEAQEVSSRKGYSSRSADEGPVTRPAARVGLRASQPSGAIRVERSSSWSWPTGLARQEEDQDSTPAAQDDSQKLQDSKLESSELEDSGLEDSELDDLDMEEPEEPSLLDLDGDEDLDELDLEYEEDPRPTRPAFGPWPKKGIRGIGIDIRETSVSVPDDVSHQLLGASGSDWTQFRPQQKIFAWAAPDIRYQPLYFEDVALERYGTTAGPYHQSCISAFHFFKDFVFLPHQMRHDFPGSCDHPLGFCRPGNTTPYTIQRHYFGRPRLSR